MSLRDGDHITDPECVLTTARSMSLTIRGGASQSGWHASAEGSLVVTRETFTSLYTHVFATDRAGDPSLDSARELEAFITDHDGRAMPAPSAFKILNFTPAIAQPFRQIQYTPVVLLPPSLFTPRPRALFSKSVENRVQLGLWFGAVLCVAYLGAEIAEDVFAWTIAALATPDGDSGASMGEPTQAGDVARTTTHDLFDNVSFRVLCLQLFKDVDDIVRALGIRSHSSVGDAEAQACASYLCKWWRHENEQADVSVAVFSTRTASLEAAVHAIADKLPCLRLAPVVTLHTPGTISDDAFNVPNSSARSIKTFSAAQFLQVVERSAPSDIRTHLVNLFTLLNNSSRSLQSFEGSTLPAMSLSLGLSDVPLARSARLSPEGAAANDMMASLSGGMTQAEYETLVRMSRDVEHGKLDRMVKVVNMMLIVTRLLALNQIGQLRVRGDDVYDTLAHMVTSYTEWSRIRSIPALLCVLSVLTQAADIHELTEIHDLTRGFATDGTTLIMSHLVEPGQHEDAIHVHFVGGKIAGLRPASRKGELVLKRGSVPTGKFSSPVLDLALNDPAVVTRGVVTFGLLPDLRGEPRHSLYAFYDDYVAQEIHLPYVEKVYGSVMPPLTSGSPDTVSAHLRTLPIIEGSALFPPGTVATTQRNTLAVVACNRDRAQRFLAAAKLGWQTHVYLQPLSSPSSMDQMALSEAITRIRGRGIPKSGAILIADLTDYRIPSTS